MTASRKIALSLAILALTQTAVLAYMVIDRVTLLRSGREITLPIVPVDPRDLFRGEYVRLAYDVSNIPARLLEGPQPSTKAAIHVVLEKKPDGAWQAVKIARDMPKETSPDRIVLKAHTYYNWPTPGAATAWVQVRYGIESYFVPEGQGRKLEDLARSKKLATLVAVDARGNAAIKGLIIDGVLQYEEPLF
jgi:uncharacterized membrane-anchored protein